VAFGVVAATVAAPHSILRTANHISSIQDYQALWLSQNAFLREVSRTHPATIIYLKDNGAGIGDGFSVQCNSPYSKYTMWLTDGMEAYYGVKEICSESDPKR
jgi:hypothetical protein